jgi:hypothetical protein
MNYYCENLNQNKKSLSSNNNNNISIMDPQTQTKSLEDRSSEEFPNVNEENGGPESENSDSDEMFVNSFDADDDDDDVQLSSPSNSHNSDVDQRWYAFRGRFVGIHNDNRPLDNHLLPDNQPPPPQQQQQEEEETDFLEMDFEPDTNSEIENEAKFSDYVIPNGHHPAHNYLPPQEFLVQPSLKREDPISSKNTGAKPKQLTPNSRPVKPSKQVSDGDNVFKICSNLNNNFIDPSSSLCRPSTSFGTSSEVYNLGASSSRQTYHSPHSSDAKIHKSPSKSASHHNHKHLRLQEERNDQFLFEIEPIKPRNSVTIYTTNCDEKILFDALVRPSSWWRQRSLTDDSFQTSLNLNPNQEMIVAYFNRSKSSSAELNLVDYIIQRSKINCNYLKLVELIQKVCNPEDIDGYSDKKFEVNFYPVRV